jgi:uncharacterized protein YicC (UPF0701 family)
MTDETQAAMPIEDAPAVEAEITDSSTVPNEPESSTTEKADDTGQARDEEGKFLSKNAQKRIDELTREKYERQREAEYWRQQAMQQRPEPVKPTEPVKLPTLEEHGYDEAKYQAALIQYVEQKASEVVETRLTQQEKQRAEQQRLSAFAERQQAFAKATPDFEARVLQDPTLPITEAMRDVIVDSENGPEIAYYLAQNRDAAEAISRLPTHLAALEMGRIEGRLSAQKEAAKRTTVTKAPPPPPTLDTTEAASSKVSTTDPASDALSTDEWVKAEQKRIAKKLRKQNG